MNFRFSKIDLKYFTTRSIGRLQCKVQRNRDKWKFIKIDLGMKGEENDLNENRKLKGNGRSRDR